MFGAAIAGDLALRMTEADADTTAHNPAAFEQMQRIAIRMMDEMKSDALFFAEGQRVPAQVRLVAPSVAP